MRWKTPDLSVNLVLTLMWFNSFFNCCLILLAERCIRVDILQHSRRLHHVHDHAFIVPDHRRYGGFIELFGELLNRFAGGRYKCLVIYWIIRQLIGCNSEAVTRFAADISTCCLINV